MRTLVIDTATEACSVALFEGAACLAGDWRLLGRGHAENLIPMIAALPERGRAERIAVSVGPGSFTGVRVGIAAAHGLAIGWQVPLSGYSSLALLAAAAEGDYVGVALHGGHGELFVQSYRRDPLVATDPLRSLPPQQAAELISARLVVGSGAQALVDARGSGDAVDALPRAADARLLPKSFRTLPPKPIYGRAPDAKPMQ